eukprot:gene2813-15503_t
MPTAPGKPKTSRPCFARRLAHRVLRIKQRKSTPKRKQKQGLKQELKPPMQNLPPPPFTTPKLVKNVIYESADTTTAQPKPIGTGLGFGIQSHNGTLGGHIYDRLMRTAPVHQLQSSDFYSSLGASSGPPAFALGQHVGAGNTDAANIAATTSTHAAGADPATGSAMAAALQDDKGYTLIGARCRQNIAAAAVAADPARIVNGAIHLPLPPYPCTPPFSPVDQSSAYARFDRQMRIFKTARNIITPAAAAAEAALAAESSPAAAQWGWDAFAAFPPTPPASCDSNKTYDCLRRTMVFEHADENKEHGQDEDEEEGNATSIDKGSSGDELEHDNDPEYASDNHGYEDIGGDNVNRIQTTSNCSNDTTNVVGTDCNLDRPRKHRRSARGLVIIGGRPSWIMVSAQPPKPRRDASAIVVPLAGTHVSLGDSSTDGYEQHVPIAQGRPSSIGGVGIGMHGANANVAMVADRRSSNPGVTKASNSGSSGSGATPTVPPRRRARRSSLPIKVMSGSAPRSTRRRSSNTNNGTATGGPVRRMRKSPSLSVVVPPATEEVPFESYYACFDEGNLHSRRRRRKSQKDTPFGSVHRHNPLFAVMSDMRTRNRDACVQGASVGVHSGTPSSSSNGGGDGGALGSIQVKGINGKRRVSGIL